MKNFNLLQIIPSLNSGGAEQGTVDVANFIGEKDLGFFYCFKWRLRCLHY